MMKQIIFLACAAFLSAHICFAAELSVCPEGCAYDMIQDAIDSASAGDTVLVGDGTYDEDVYMNKSITLRSVNGSASTIIPEGLYTENSLYIQANGSKLIGFTVADGVVLDQVNNIVVAENNLSGGNFTEAISVEYSHDSLIYLNIISKREDNGIYIISSSNIRIYENNISKNLGSGVMLSYNCTNNFLYGNIMSDNSEGLSLSSSTSGNNISMNVLTGNTYGIYLRGNGNIVTQNTVTGNKDYGVFLAGTSNGSLIRGNTICDNADSDIYNDSAYTNAGDNNMCGAAGGWKDAGAVSGCVYSCSSVSTTTSTPTTSSSTPTTSSTTTTQGQCSLPGDYPPCGPISLDEIVNHINKWAADRAALEEVINLILEWARQK